MSRLRPVTADCAKSLSQYAQATWLHLHVELSDFQPKLLRPIRLVLP